ncbi:hypothetical protein DI09_363p10 [Mitosporidium daphniae]|uniref:Secreted protein n=1 Tax=Mitosporidium daphniae TaxID=1485682 RepID=A0A098VR61_9MICR|nr:uncharacterized protein DI09_363p10 [Mitosporidium daphniae]KGG51410.1 hypothetical protein DI09_363p10 [Mitosporidium daphniae]|eukprot:XP_013237846.1 uncharacterized protein DI09_363p10 [Mitosporidium daphniae]
MWIPITFWFIPSLLKFVPAVSYCLLHHAIAASPKKESNPRSRYVQELKWPKNGLPTSPQTIHHFSTVFNKGAFSNNLASKDAPSKLDRSPLPNQCNLEL